MVDKFPFLRYTVLVLGGLAQLVERLLCKQDVSGSSPLTSTNVRSQIKCRNSQISVVFNILM